MAYIPQDEEEQKQLGNTNQVLSEVPTGDEAPSTGGGTGMSGTGPKSQNLDNPGFANLMQYMNANNEQASSLADDISGNLQNEYNSAKGSIDSAAGKASDAARSSTINYDDNLVNGALQDPTGFVSGEGNLDKFIGQRDASYKGPGSFEDSSFYGEAAKGSARVNDIYNANKQGGYEGLLSQLQSNPTKGKSALDIGLLNANPAATGKIKAALQPFEGINSYLSGKAEGVNNEIAGAKKTTQETSDKTRAALQPVVQSFGADISKRLADTKSSAGASAEALKAKLLSGGQLTSQDLHDLGINGMNLTELRNVMGNLKGDYDESFDISPYYSAQNPDAAFTAENVARPEDFARESALQQLMGEDLPFLRDDMSGQAGTAPGSLSKFDIEPAYGDARGLLSTRDQAILDKYKGANMFGQAQDQSDYDPKSFRTKLHAFQRNTDDLSPGAKAWLSVMQGETNSPFTPSDPRWTQPGTTPSDGLTNPYAPPAEGQSPTRYIDSPDGSGAKFMWYDNGQWVDAPQEYRNFQNGGYTEKFNYQTGQYEPTGWTGPTTDELGNSNLGPGIVSGSGTYYIDPKTGEKKTIY